MAELPRPSTAMLRRTLDANLRYYEAVGEVTLDWLRALRALTADGAQAARAPAPGATASPPTLVLEGEAGETAVGAFLIENLLAERVSAPVTVSAFAADDGSHAAIQIALDPEVVTLDPGEQTLVRAAAAVSDALAPGQDYRGEISVPGLTGTRVPVVVRRREPPPP